MGTGTRASTWSSTEASRASRFRTAGTISKLYVVVSANTTTGGSNSVTVRNNAADTSMTVAIGTGATGAFEDVANTASIAAGNDMAYKVITGSGGTMTFRVKSVIFEPTDGAKTVTVFVAGNTNITTASVTRFLRLVSSITETTEANTQYKTRTAGTLKNLAIRTATNSRTTTTTWRSRKNTANGALVYSILATDDNVYLEDTTNSDTLASGDNLNHQWTTGSGTQTLTVSNIKTEFETTNNKFVFLCGPLISVPNFAAAITYYNPIAGGMHTTTTAEVNIQTKSRIPLTLSNLGLYISANSLDSGTSTTTVRKNAADTLLTLSFGFGATGLFEDVSNVVTTNETDGINYVHVISGTTGTATVTWIGCLAQEILTQPIIENQQLAQQQIATIRTATMRSTPSWVNA